MKMNEVSAGILAGGLSSRMGTNKSFLKHGDATILTRLIKECEEFQKIYLSVGDEEPYREFGCILVKDELQKFGPLEGIYQVLKASQTDYVFVLATDMPEVTKAFLKEMTEALHDEKCFVAKTKGYMHPLCGIYHKSIIPELERMRRENIRKVRLLFENTGIRYYDVDDDRLLTNVNTPEQYQKWEEEHRYKCKKETE